MVPAHSHSRAVEDYLKAIYKLERGVAGAAAPPAGVSSTPASTSALAEALERSAASVTNMVKSLADQGLVRHEPYRGVRLTPVGRRAALRIIRRHRVIETYLIERLGYTWDGVHVEAERLEHAASDDLVDRMARALGDPDVDPHGAPIPGRDGSISRRELTALGTLPAGGRGCVRQVSDEDDDRLRALSAMGLLLDTEVEMLRPGEDGGCRVRIAGHEHELEPDLAADVLVEPVATEPAN
ncbi:MAG TPA: metal-dependent transcriptional regulator [Gemmatimonadota bacterium]|nr:metal-dependent transcriptional regulator [Gemmatimonadota bacterium]